MRFEECDQRGEQAGSAARAPKFVRPDSGQFEEPPRPPFVAERCRKCGEGERNGSFGVCCGTAYKLC